MNRLYKCFACGRVTSLRHNLTSNHVCKNPSSEFEDTFTALSTEEIEKLKCDDEFLEQLIRHECQKTRLKTEIATAVEKEPREISEDIVRYSQKDRVSTDEGDVEIEIPEKQESASDIAAETVTENQIENEETDEETTATALGPEKSLRHGFVDTSGRINPTKRAQNFPVPVVQADGKLIPILDTTAIHDESGRDLYAVILARQAAALRPNPLPPVNKPRDSRNVAPVELCPHNSIPKECPTCEPLRVYREWQALTPEERSARLERSRNKFMLSLQEEANLIKQNRIGKIADASRTAAERYLGVPTADLKPPIEPIAPSDAELAAEFNARQRTPGDENRDWSDFTWESELWNNYRRQKLAYDEARRQFERKPSDLRPGEFVLLRRILKIIPPDIVAWLDKIVPATERIIQTKIPVRIVNPEKRRVLIEPPAALLEERERLTSEIKNLEQQKVELGSPKRFNKKRLEEEGTRTDISDKDRARFKRELKKDIEKLDAEIRPRRSRKRKIDEELREWNKDPNNPNHYRIEKVPGTGTVIPEHIERHCSPKTFGQFITDGKGFETIDSGKLGAYLTYATDPDVRPYPGLGGFENRLIQVAIEAKVFDPGVLKESVPKHFHWIVWGDQGEQPEQPEGEDKELKRSIFVTGGASEGLSIHSAGKNSRGHYRNLSSFNTRPGKTDKQYENPESSPSAGSDWSTDFPDDDKE